MRARSIPLSVRATAVLIPLVLGVAAMAPAASAQDAQPLSIAFASDISTFDPAVGPQWSQKIVADLKPLSQQILQRGRSLIFLGQVLEHFGFDGVQLNSDSLQFLGRYSAAHGRDQIE